MADHVVVPRGRLDVSPTDKRSSGWHGLVFMIATEAALFVYLLFSYYFLASQSAGPWPSSGAPRLAVALPSTFVLLASSGAAQWGVMGIERGRSARLAMGRGLALALGSAFAGLQLWEWAHKSFTPATDVYGSLYFTITGVHLLHVAVGLLILAFLLVWTLMGRFTTARHEHITLGVYYWHFVDVVWLAVFTTFYLTPRLG